MANVLAILSLRGICLIAVIFCAVWHSGLADSKICGEAINQALKLMCENGYNTHKTKRNYPLEEDLSDIEEENFGPFEMDQLPFWTSMTPNSLAKLRRRRDGIYYECCRKPCTKQELMTYCR